MGKWRYALLALAVLIPAFAGGAETAATAPPLLAPDGGWLAEYEVKFKGEFRGTAADPPDQPLRGALDAARGWAREQGLRPQWTSGPFTSAAKTEEALQQTVRPGTLTLSVLSLNRDYSEFKLPGTTHYTVPNQDVKDMAYVARLGIALRDGTLEQRDALHARLLALPGVTAGGAWPLRDYLTTRLPQYVVPQSITIDGQPYNWQTDLTPAERTALYGELCMLNAKRAGPPWSGDIYKVGHPLSEMPRFGLGPLLRFRYAGGGLSIDRVPVMADFKLLQTVSWKPEASLMVEADEADLPFNPGELIIEASRGQYESTIRPYDDGFNPSAYRAGVRLAGAADAGADAARLEALLQQWRARYPELQPGGALEKALSSGPVEGADHPQWQVTLQVRSSELAHALLRWLQEQGVAVETFAPVTPDPAAVQRRFFPQNTRGYYGSEEDRKWKWQVTYHLVPEDPHGFDAELTLERIGSAAGAATIKLRDELQAKYRTWLAQQLGLTGSEFEERLQRHFSGHGEDEGVVPNVTVQARDEAEAQSLRTLLAGPGVPEPELKPREHYLGQDYPRGMTLRWKLVPASTLRGILPGEVRTKLDRKLAARIDADAAALRKALADWLAGPHPPTDADGTELGPQLELNNFGDMPRTVTLATPYPEGVSLDELEQRLRQAAPGLPAAERSKPYNYAFEPQQLPAFSGADWQRELLRYELLDWSQMPTIGADELADFLGPVEIKRLQQKAADVGAAVQTWNQTQPDADRITVELQKSRPDATLPYAVRLLGSNNRLDAVKSLMTALERAGLPDYHYGFGFTQRNRPSWYGPQPGANQVPLKRLYYKLVPSVYTMYGGGDLSLRLARYYTPAQLAELKQTAQQAKEAVRTWAAQNGLTFNELYQGFDRPDSVRITVGGLGRGDVPTHFQAALAVEDPGPREELARSLELYLAQQVPALPKRDNSGMYAGP